MGAAAQLGGVTRMTLSITVLVMEGTGALQLVVPMMLAVFVAKIVGDSVSMGVYDLHIKIRGAPVLVSVVKKLELCYAFLFPCCLFSHAVRHRETFLLPVLGGYSKHRWSV